MPQKWLKEMRLKSYQDHIQRLETMKPAIDSKPPRSKPKSRKQEIETRLKKERIDKDNIIFLERLAKTMARKNIDNINTNRDHLLKLRKFQAITKKKVEEQKIAEGNQRLLKRILQAPGAYNHSEWEEDAIRHEIYLRNMTEFPELQPQTRATIATPLKPKTSAAVTMQRLALPLSPSITGRKPMVNSARLDGISSSRKRVVATGGSHSARNPHFSARMSSEGGGALTGRGYGSGSERGYGYGGGMSSRQPSSGSSVNMLISARDRQRSSSYEFRV